MATKRVECLKCEDCGHSWIPETKKPFSKEGIAATIQQPTFVELYAGKGYSVHWNVGGTVRIEDEHEDVVAKIINEVGHNWFPAIVSAIIQEDFQYDLQGRKAQKSAHLYEVIRVGDEWHLVEKKPTPEQEEIANNILAADGEKPAKKYYANRDSAGKPIYVGDTLSIYIESESGIGVVTLATPTVIKVKLGNHNYTTDVTPVDGKVFAINGEDAEVYVYDDSFLKSLFKFVLIDNKLQIVYESSGTNLLYRIWCYVHGFDMKEGLVNSNFDYFIPVHKELAFVNNKHDIPTPNDYDKFVNQVLTTLSTIYTKTIKALAPIFREHTFGSPIDKFAEYCEKQGIEFVK